MNGFAKASRWQAVVKIANLQIDGVVIFKLTVWFSAEQHIRIQHKLLFGSTTFII